ncbi:MAG: hypothetical protein M5U10_06320 [Candidatus Methanoperedens sp.]|uniref:hypothetical protein n=1 Tax=Candidatus Methanoperedens nitratireducens TaxID=1392998 RepID=UPI0012FEFBF8|nr:hypothetical protein [Candidatus Methanoperedens nitroreducens]MDJ1421512.1 hypothetical protein [Candidatus Methanoperedens sp.]
MKIIVKSREAAPPGAPPFGVTPPPAPTPMAPGFEALAVIAALIMVIALRRRL